MNPLRFLAFFTIIWMHQEATAQTSPYHSGQFRLGPSDAEFDFDTSRKEVDSYSQALYSKIYHVVFTDKKYAIVRVSPDGEVQHRIVCDYDKGECFTFDKSRGVTTYYSLSKIEHNSFYQRQASLLFDDHVTPERMPNDTLIHGLACKVMNLVSYRGVMKCYLTDQLNIPNTTIERRNERFIIDSLAVVGFQQHDGDVYMIDTFYTTIRNPEWLSISTEGIPEYSEYMQSGNIEFIKKWMATSAPKDSMYLKAYKLYQNKILAPQEMKWLIDYNKPPTYPELIFKTLASDRYSEIGDLFLSLHQLSILRDHQHDILQQLVSDSILSYSSNVREYILLLEFLDMLASQKHRSILVTNLKMAGYVFEPHTDQIISEFIDGSHDLSTLLYATEELSPLPAFFELTDRQRIENSLDTFFSQLFPLQWRDCDLSIMSSGKDMIINILSQEEEYQWSMDAYHGEDREDQDSPDREKEDLGSADYIGFMYQLLPLIQQLATDWDIQSYFDINTFSSNIPGGYHLHEVEKVSGKKIFPSDYYLSRIHKKKGPYYASDIPLDKHIQDERGLYPVSISHLHYGNGENNIDFLRTKEKRKLIDLIKAREIFTHLTPKEIGFFTSNIENRNIPLNGNFISYIPRISHTSNVVYDQLPLSIKNKPDFKTVFPALYHFLRREYNPTSIERLSPGNKIKWREADGIESIITLSSDMPEQSVLYHFHSLQSGHNRGIYYYPTFQLTERTYYYLTAREREIMESMLGERLTPISSK